MDQETIDELVKKIWDYHHLNQKLEKADLILVLGNYDTRTAERAANIFLKGWAPLIIFAGNKGNFTGDWDRSEAEVFSEIAVAMGVPREKILLEDKSTNTGENINFSKKLLQEKSIPIEKVIVVCNPIMERRAYATFKKVWPEKGVVVTSPLISFEEWPDRIRTKEELTHVLVGWLQRIKIWAERGYQIPQEIPVDVWSAYKKLVAVGYNKYLVK